MGLFGVQNPELEEIRHGGPERTGKFAERVNEGSGCRCPASRCRQ